MPYKLEQIKDGWRIEASNKQIQVSAEWDKDGKLISESISEPEPQPEIKQTAKPTLAQSISGAAKIIKAEAGIGKPDEDTISKRQSICEGCEFFDFGKCGNCGCILWHKIRNKNETCPLGKW